MNFKIKKGDLVRKFNLTSEVFFYESAFDFADFHTEKGISWSWSRCSNPFSPHKADYMKKMRKKGSQREEIAEKSRECQFWVSNVHKISFLCAISSRRETVFYIFCVYSVITSTIFGFQHFSYLCQDMSDS